MEREKNICIFNQNISSVSLVEVKTCSWDHNLDKQNSYKTAFKRQQQQSTHLISRAKKKDNKEETER